MCVASPPSQQHNHKIIDNSIEHTVAFVRTNGQHVELAFFKPDEVLHEPAHLEIHEFFSGEEPKLVTSLSLQALKDLVNDPEVQSYLQ
jgi:hypothetical protein